MIVAEATTTKINGEYIHTPIGKQPSEVPRAQETAAVTTWSAPTAAGYTDFPFHPQG